MTPCNTIDLDLENPESTVKPHHHQAQQVQQPAAAEKHPELLSGISESGLKQRMMMMPRANNKSSNNDESLGAAGSSQGGNSSGFFTSSSNGSRNNNKNHNNGHHHHKPPESRHAKTLQRRVVYGRILFLIVLGIVASILGVIAHLLLKGAEQKLAEQQFHSIADRALIEAKDVAHRRLWAGVTMSRIVSEQYPSADEWPLQVPFWGFERLARALLNASSGVDMGFVPLVYPEQQEEWEDFAYSVYEELGWPNTTAVSPSFGRGVWAADSTKEVPYNRYHDSFNGSTTWNSSYQVLTPVFRTDDGVHPVLMYNPHSDETRGLAIDSLLHCSDDYTAANSNEGAILSSSSLEEECSVMTQMIQNVKYKGRLGVTRFTPVAPSMQPNKVTGFISVLLIIDELLANAFADEVSGIDAVFETESQVVTFTVVDGSSYLVSEDKDAHDPEYDAYKQSTTLYEQKPSMVVQDSHNRTVVPEYYRLHLYPNDNFYKVYETNNPTVATVGSVAVILITSLCFFLYDCCVRREFHAKRELLQARRQFMRYVSHEVRTPLNSICMGLELVQGELAKSMGYDTLESAKAAEMDDTASSSSTASTTSSSPALSTPATTNSDSSNDKAEKRAWFLLTQEVESNAQVAIDILNDLLNYDKIEEGTLQIEQKLVPIWDLLRTSITEFKASATSKHIDLKITYGIHHCQDTTSTPLWCDTTQQLPEHVRNDLVLVGDSVRMTQVLRNLISNALKFTPEGGRVEVQALYRRHRRTLSHYYQDAMEFATPNQDSVQLQNAGSIDVTVQDTGAGMSQDQLTKLFREGVQFNVNQLQAGQGSGLGLFIAKGIAEQHNGVLTASSEGLGHGTAFTMTLPLWELPATTEAKETAGTTTCTDDIISSKKEETTDVYTAEESKTESTTSSTTAGSAAASSSSTSLKVLVVDDVTSNRKLLSRLLENAGHSCDGAESGQGALDMVAKSMQEPSGEPYDCILLDYEMPGMNGPMAAQQIREMGLDVFIVGVTGNVLPEDVAYFKSCGANDVLAKPIKLAEIECIWMEYGIYDRYHRRHTGTTDIEARGPSTNSFIAAT